jgi:hypothetical protein
MPKNNFVIKYRAFLSYGHADTKWAKWLHGRLECFRFDTDLIRTVTPRAPVPRTLRPIFGDREDFSGGHSLTEATVAALDASAALIVLCSTISATRPAVNEEVRLFRSRHPDRPVIPVIIEGHFPVNFPPALRFELAADGSLSDRSLTILGPDLRKSGDGKGLGLAKVVAGLTGLSSDDVYRRAERARLQQGRVRAAVAAVIAALTIIGGWFFWQSRQQHQTLAEVAALLDKHGAAQASVPGVREGLTQAITAIVEGSATDRRYTEALELLRAGKARADKDGKGAAAAYRNLASIAGVSDPKREAMFWNGAFQLDAGQAEAWFGQLAQNHLGEAGWQRDLSLSYDRVGDVQTKPGYLAEALKFYRDGLVIR